jgi:hypothetical protein
VNNPLITYRRMKIQRSLSHSDTSLPDTSLRQMAAHSRAAAISTIVTPADTSHGAVIRAFMRYGLLALRGYCCASGTRGGMALRWLLGQSAVQLSVADPRCTIRRGRDPSSLRAIGML